MKFFDNVEGREPVSLSDKVNRYFIKESIKDDKCQGECCREVDENGDPNQGRIPQTER